MENNKYKKTKLGKSLYKVPNGFYAVIDGIVYRLELDKDKITEQTSFNLVVVNDD